MEVAQHQRFRNRAGPAESVPPARAIGGPPVGVDGEPDGGQVPVEQVVRLGHEQIVGIGSETGRDGRRGGKTVERYQRIDGELVERRLVLAAGKQPREGVIAQILHQQKSGGPVLRRDARRAEAEGEKMASDGGVRLDRLAVGRGVHEHGCPRPAADPEVAAERGIGGEGLHRGAVPPGAGEEAVDFLPTRGSGQAPLRSAPATPGRPRFRPRGRPRADPGTG